MGVKTFVVHPEWIEDIVDLPVETQDKIIAEFVRHGAGQQLQHEDDKFVSAYIKRIIRDIDYSKNKYEEAKITGNRGGGRKKVVDDEKIRELASSGKSCKEIAEILNYSTNTIYKSDGWKDRYIVEKTNDGFEF